MKKKSFILLSVVVVFLLVSVFISFLAFRPGKYIYITGNVTKYDITPTYVDGSAIFEVDGKSVDIGGGLEAGERGEFENGIKIGDRVTAKLVKRDGYLTTYDCPECYVRKQN